MEGKSDKDQNSEFLRTDGGKTKSNALEAPSISLPKGGGAIKGIDEKFSVNAVNGTASLSFPLPFSSARGASPSLSISYNSGSGNGIFGLGWNSGLASIRRKTDKGLPQYRDLDDSDTFLFSEAEDLVPAFRQNADDSFVLDQHGNFWIDERESENGLYMIRRYRPRIEGLFSRIERWALKDLSEIKWKIVSKENVTTLFGWSSASRITDPRDRRRIFEWLPEFVFDDKGNCSHYKYKEEDEKGVDPLLIHNRNRIDKDGNVTYANLYPEKVLYGNKTPYPGFGSSLPAEGDYLFATVFDYGEYRTDDPDGQTGEWDFRPDAFSDYKAGFEIRTTRLCRRVLLFHRFEDDEYNGLVRSLDFVYDTTTAAGITFLKSITATGYVKRSDGTYAKKSLPETSFEYQPHDWSTEVKEIASEDLVNAPAGLDEPQYQFIDLFNEGLSGILSEQAGGWFYKHNLGNGRFERAKAVTPKPSFIGVGGQLQFVDLDGDGGKQLANFNSEPRGYFELSDDNEWLPFRSFEKLPNIDLADASARMLDLNGDGRAEVLIADDSVFTFYLSDGRKGFAGLQKSPISYDQEESPHIVFADQTETIFLADMSGDGLTDIVRIRNGETCYWPNLGYGKFGARVSMDNSPLFDTPDLFNPAYIRLADIDGSGTTDIIYLGKKKFTCWLNLSGNGFRKQPFDIEAFPEIDSNSKVTVTDLLGNGVACIVWSSPLSVHAISPLKYIDLMNGKKPHIMVSYRNNLGKEVELEYTPSTRFYIEDKLAGKPWVTKLHFPVHCVSRTITTDKISGYRFESSYKYHHGYYDHAEREFRGFGMVEQTDSEDFEHWVKRDATNITDRGLHQEPVVNRSWHHTGAFLGKEKILTQFAHEYWYEEMARRGLSVTHREVSLPDARIVAAPGLPQSTIDTLSPEEWREALRACKGMSLRAEVFARDAIKHGDTVEARKKELTPYSVTAKNCVVELLQPKGKNKHAVFVVKESESVAYNYERNTEDPRIAHNINVKLDRYGNIIESASIVYPRRAPDMGLPSEIRAGQAKTAIIYTSNEYTNDVIDEVNYHLRMPSDVKTYELRGVAKVGALYAPEDFADILSDARSDRANYHELEKMLTAGKAGRRLIEHVRTTYRDGSLKNALPLHRIVTPVLPFESYQLAYTPELLDGIFGTKANANLLQNEGKYTHSYGDANWWIRSGTTQFIEGSETTQQARARFYMPVSYTDPYGAKTRVRYYGSYSLFIDQTEDALGNRAGVENFSFRTLSPQRMYDINGNFSEAISDELGLVKAVAVMGKGTGPGNTEADDLSGLAEAAEAAEKTAVANFFSATDSNQLRTIGNTLLRHATTRFVYDVDVYRTSGKPVVVASISREEHFQKNNNSPIQMAFEYSNGLGQVVMKKAQAEPGKAKRVTVGANNSYTVSETDTSVLNPKQLRWIGTGRTILNNKGNPVKQYEPYFSVTPQYEDHKELVETGVTPVMYYDALGRLIKMEMPDRTFSKVEFDSWKQAVYDANDTVLESAWYRERALRLIDARLTAEGKDPAKEAAAANKAAAHANTANILHFDTLGRPVLSIEHNRKSSGGPSEFYLTRVELDVEGNLRRVVDARGNTVMEYQYDMLGNSVFQDSMDAGRRWLLMNILGNPLRTWDERGHEFRYFYDVLHRPKSSRVLGGDGGAPLDNIFDLVIYGDDLLTAGRANEAALRADNVLGKAVKRYDTGGLVDTPRYDFKGQPISTTRKLFKHYKQVPNWTPASLAADLETGSFTFTTETDALGRITEQSAPDGSIITPFYNEAGLLTSEEVLLPGATAGVEYIKDIDYNEKGQREKTVYGNGVTTRYKYDKETFRLLRLESARQSGDLLQDWRYTYDPAGNITHIADNAAPVIFYKNNAVAALSEYTYDALYRLISAKGREHAATLAFGSDDNWNDGSFMELRNPDDPLTMRGYTQSYQYDRVGNILEMRHQANGGNWTRNYEYETANNRLIRTQIGTRVFDYEHHPEHGFIKKMPHLVVMGWNFKEELVKTIRQRVTNGGTPETTYYQYDAQGQRIRKVTENQAAPGATPTKKNERIYLAGYEVYRETSGANTGLKRTSLSLMDEGHRFVMIETRNDVDDGTAKQLTRYQMHNHLGSACLELDDTARVISYEEFHPYGTTAYQAKNSAINSAAKRYRYTGMERDEETGLEYHSARYYIPWLGRWLSADPIGIGDGLNLYKGMNSNPIRNNDPSGMVSDDLNAILGDIEKYGAQLARGKEKIAEHVMPHKLIEYITKIDPNDTSKEAEFLRQHMKGLITEKDYGKATTIVWEKYAASLKTYGEGDIAHLKNVRDLLKSNSPIDALKEIDKAAANAMSALENSGTKISPAAYKKALALQMTEYAGKSSFRVASARFFVRKAEELAQLAKKVGNSKTATKLVGAAKHTPGTGALKALAITATGYSLIGTAQAAEKGIGAATEGNYDVATTNLGTAGLDTVELTPTPAGAVVGAGRMGYGLGEAFDEGLGIGERAQAAATESEKGLIWLGASPESARNLAAVSASLEAINDFNRLMLNPGALNQRISEELTKWWNN
ncbi:MAG: SpvB/TcaC N-terminal domain-containing protein [Pyrinomonadaceae bacterium]